MRIVIATLVATFASCTPGGADTVDETQAASAPATASVGPNANATSVSSHGPTPKPTASATARASAALAPAPLPPADAPFVHEPGKEHAVDLCIPHGGIAFSCLGAYADEKDPVQKRYLRRVASGFAAGVRDYASKEPKMEQGMLPHAEVPSMCDPERPCNDETDTGVYNGELACLARTLEAVQMHDPTSARRAHAHACKCNPTNDFIGYNATAFICDENGKPAFLSPNMSKAEGADILACARCDAKRGPRACKSEIVRLEKSDAPLADYVRTVQIPRCQTKP